MNEIANDIYETDYIIEDFEIQKLANLSHKTKGIIEEFKGKDGYSMIFKSYDKGKETESVLIFSSNAEKYKEASSNFFKKFIHYNGDISLGEIFGNKIVTL